MTGAGLYVTGAGLPETGVGLYATGAGLPVMGQGFLMRGRGSAAAFVSALTEGGCELTAHKDLMVKGMEERCHGDGAERKELQRGSL